LERLIFSLGLIPVQEWIAQARRSRDLRAGSVFLWYTMARVLARLEEDFAAEIWLPRPPRGWTFQKLAALPFSQALAEPYGIPHRASGVCQSLESPEKAFSSLQELVAAAWRDLREKLLTREEFSSGFWKGFEPHWTRYREATADGGDCPLTLIWAARPVASELSAEEALKAADRLYGEVKRTRPFRPWAHGTPVGKCTQCGRREAIGPTAGFAAWRSWHEERAQDPWVQAGTRIDAAERLCYVCLTKRLAGYASTGQRKFPSTGEIAAAAWLHHLRQEPELQQEVERLEATATGRDDLARALYAPPLDLPEAERETILAIRSLLPSPPRYLALLTFDGDDMGRKVRQDARGMSEAMNDFAERASGIIVDEFHGRAFYLGGDEGLAMAPADGVLDLAHRLRDAFQESFAAMASPPTLSMGVALFEHGRPMRGAIRAAGDVLKTAKSRPGKSALAVCVETASGNRWGFTAPWGDRGDDWHRLRGAVGLIQKGFLSSGWAYDVEAFVETLPAERWTEAGTRDAARAELERLFLRRSRGEGKTAAERRTAIRQAWASLRGNEWWPDDREGKLPDVDPQQFHLIGFLSRQAATAPSEDLKP
jgi:CRISPR RNA silencing complex Cmr2 subunit-like protein